MAQKKHKKRKQHTKTKLTDEQREQAAAQSAAAAKAQQKKGLRAKKAGNGASAAAAKKDNGKDVKQGKPTLLGRFVNWCKSVKVEMQRVVWPTRKELLNASLIVIGAIVFFGVYIAIIDNIVVIPLDLISTLGA